MRASCSSILWLISFSLLTVAFVQSLDCGTPGYGEILPRPSHGHRSHYYSQNTKIYYECPQFQYLLGNKERICYENGTWSGSIPKCVPPSGNIAKVLIVQEVTFSLELNKECLKCLMNNNEDEVDCIPNYLYPKDIQIDLSGSVEVLAVRIATKPKSEQDVLVLRKTEIEAGARCKIDDSKYEKDAYTYSCGNVGNSIQIGYRDAQIKITKVSIYLGSSARYCGIPDKPMFGWYHLDDRTGIYSYGCNQGILHGHASTYCNEKGEWNNPAPVCSKQTRICDIKELSTPHGTWTKMYDDEAKLTCNQGYEVSGNNPIVKCYEGHWQNNPVECQPTITKDVTITQQESDGQANVTTEIDPEIDDYSSVGFTTTATSRSPQEDSTILDHNMAMDMKPSLRGNSMDKLGEDKVMKIVIISSVSSSVTAVCILIVVIILIKWKRRCNRRRENRRSVGTAPATPRPSTGSCMDHVYQDAIYEEMEKTGQNPYVMTPGRKRSMPKIPDILELVYSDNRNHRAIGSFSSDRLPGYGVHIYSEPLYSEVSEESQRTSERSVNEMEQRNETVDTEEHQEDVFVENDFYESEV